MLGWINDLVQQGRLKFKYVSTELNIADLHTKVLCAPRLMQLMRLAGMKTQEEFESLSEAHYLASRECVEVQELRDAAQAEIQVNGNGNGKSFI